MTARTTAHLKRIAASARRYRRRVREFSCRYDPARAAFVYTLRLARAGSGTRGGRVRSPRHYEFLNLTPEQRALVEALPREEPPR